MNILLFFQATLKNVQWLQSEPVNLKEMKSHIPVLWSKMSRMGQETYPTK